MLTPPDRTTGQQEKGKALTGEGANDLGKGASQAQNMQIVAPDPLPLEQTSKPGSDQ